MSVRFWSLLSVAVLLMGFVALPAAASEQVDVIVVFNDSVTNSHAAAGEAAAQHGVELDFVYEHALKGFSGSVAKNRLQGLERDSRVAYVESDKPVAATAVTLPTGIDRVDADQNGTLDIDGIDDQRVDVDVAIIDTGIDLDHPDLNVVDGVNCLNSDGGPPWSRTYTCESGGDDGHGHGTHVAGTVAALDDGTNVDGVDVVGVAPGARLHAVKVLDDTGSGSTGSVIAGIDWVTAHGGIEVANMSLGGSGESQAMDDALQASYEAGVAYAVAAGNSSANVNDYHPAGSPWVLTVSALADFDGLTGGDGDPSCRDDVDDTFADFSNFGDEEGQDVDVIAPGVCILSTYPGGGYTDGWSGTSMASPHVAGAAAILASSDATGIDIVGEVVDGVDGDGIIEKSGGDDWDAGDDGDTTKEPLADVGDGSVFAATLVSSSDSGSTDDPPTISITDPNHGDTVSGTVDVMADASDDNGVDQVEFFVDSNSIGTDTDGSDGWSVSWDTTANSDGDHEVTATATDTVGQTGSDSISVTVDNSATNVDVTGVDTDLSTEVAEDTLSPGTTKIEVYGEGFDVSSSVTFENGKGPSPEATVMTVNSDGTVITAEVTVKSGGPSDYWDLRVTNSDNSSGVLTDAVYVSR